MTTRRNNRDVSPSSSEEDSESLISLDKESSMTVNPQVASVQIKGIPWSKLKKQLEDPSFNKEEFIVSKA